jgi:SulP family sulfate permease
LLLSSTAGDWLAFIPMPAIAALLLVVACSLLDVRGWRRLWRLDRRDFAIAGTTALATVTIRMEVAILLGAMLSLLAYLYRTSRPAVRIMGFDVCVGKGEISGRPFVVRDAVPQPLPECPQLKMIRMEGDVYFGAAAHVAECLRQLREGESAPRHLLVMSKSMNFIDLSGDDLWRAEMRRRRAGGGDLYFHRPRPEVLALWERTRFIEDLGSEHIFASKRAALATIFRRLDRSLCHRCRARVFEECLDSSDR